MAFRVDASREIGLGHAMRCFSLAQELRENGWRTRFVSRQMPEGFKALLRAAGHEFTSLMAAGSAPATWRGEPADAQDTISALADASWDWIVADHYQLGAVWESTVRAPARKILAVDDKANREHDCDVLLDQNLVLEMDRRYVGKVPQKCTLLLGPRYALLRRSFADLRDSVSARNGHVRRLLILMGGMDADNQTGKAIAAVKRTRAPHVEVDVIVGSDHPALATVKAECDHAGIRCHVQTENVALLMAKADLALGGCGSTSWERCCLGLPAICMSLADNQLPIADGLAAAGAIVYLGPSSAVEEGDLARALAETMADAAGLERISRNCLDLVDGQGADRVCEVMATAG